MVQLKGIKVPEALLKDEEELKKIKEEKEEAIREGDFDRARKAPAAAEGTGGFLSGGPQPL